MRLQSSLTIAIASVVALTLGASVPAEAACKRMGFVVNDYGKDGPTKDAQDLLEKDIAKWAAGQGVKSYTVNKKNVTCELYLDLIVFDEHTCTASATVCWDEKNPGKAAAAPDAKAGDAPAATTPVVEKAADSTDAKAKAAADKATADAVKAKAQADKAAKVETGTVDTKAPDVKPAAATESAAKPITGEMDASQAAAAAAERAAAAAERAAVAAERAAQAAMDAQQAPPAATTGSTSDAQASAATAPATAQPVAPLPSTVSP